MMISTRVWGAQHPNIGGNIQQKMDVCENRQNCNLAKIPIRTQTILKNMGEKLSGAWGGGAGIEWLFNVMYYIWLRMLKVC